MPSKATTSRVASPSSKTSSSKSPSKSSPKTSKKLTSSILDRVLRKNKSKPPAPPAPKIVLPSNHVAFLIDRSGSMDHLRESVVRAFNDNLTTIKEEVYKNTTSNGKSDQRTTLTSALFSTTVEFSRVLSPVDTLKTMKVHEYRPEGRTALLQAVGETIEALEKSPDAAEDTTSFLVITITDGEENGSSHRWVSQLVEKMRKCQATDRWSFVFLVPDERAKQLLADTYKVPAGNISVWAATSEGVSKASQAVSAGVSSYYRSRALGHRSVKEFFKADLSGVKKKDLSKLEDLSGEAKLLAVTGEIEIKTFIESKLRKPYITGAAFYELTKDEKVQAYKKIAIKERSGKKVYGGDDARQLLGLPDGDVKLRIENLANYQVFVQSTSVNRRLVRGTSVLYIPSLA